MDFLNNIVAFGIAIFLTILTFLFIDFVYPQPIDYYYDYNSCYERFNCDKALIDCEKNFEQNSSNYETRVNECRNEILKREEYKNCMKEQYICSQENLKKSQGYKHSKISFFILTIVGILMICASMLLIGIEVLKSGLMLSGIIVIIISTLKSWSYLMYNKGLSIFMIFIVLLILIFYSYKKSFR
jgi:hypothetical protein